MEKFCISWDLETWYKQDIFTSGKFMGPMNDILEYFKGHFWRTLHLLAVNANFDQFKHFFRKIWLPAHKCALKRMTWALRIAPCQNICRCVDNSIVKIARFILLDTNHRTHLHYPFPFCLPSVYCGPQQRIAKLLQLLACSFRNCAHGGHGWNVFFQKIG